jgi:cytosine/adenosine deaminase-related metal-dependent hydrolase
VALIIERVSFRSRGENYILARVLIKSKFLTVDGTRILHDAVLRVERGKIRQVRRARAREPGALDAGRALLMPGLVNAHCHLELTYARGRLPSGAPMSRWLRELVATYRGRGPADWVDSLRAGLRRLARHGTTAVGDICNRPALLGPHYRGDPIRKIVYAEVIGPWPERERRQWAAARRLGHGISPHAPYTTSAEAYRRCARAGLPAATHVAESRDELRFLMSGDGPIAELLRHESAPAPFARPPRTTPVRYLDRLGMLRPHVTLIHANYLTDPEIGLIARRGCPVVFCPGSHAFFGHAPHPVRRLLARGVCVALGTDSLASNEELSMLREMRLVRERYGIDASTALRMGTRNGAAALFGRRARIGRLRVGWAADLTCVAIPPGQDPLEAATRTEPPVRFAMAAGRWVKPP